MTMQTLADSHLDFVRRQLKHPPAWASSTLCSWEKTYAQEKQPFLRRHYWSETGSINVFRVVGTEHRTYQGQSWLDLLIHGDCMPHNLQALQNNPGYYLQPTARRPALYFNTLDGLHFYVGADGNHRTCIARFFLAEQDKSQLHDVTLNHYQVNDNFHRLYRQLQEQIKLLNLPIQLTPERALLGREDTAGWKMDTYCTTLNWVDLTTYQTMTLTEAQAQELLSELMRRQPPEPVPQNWKTKLKQFISR